MVNKCTWAKLEVQKRQREFSHDKQRHMSTTNISTQAQLVKVYGNTACQIIWSTKVQMRMTRGDHQPCDDLFLMFAQMTKSCLSIQCDRISIYYDSPQRETGSGFGSLAAHMLRAFIPFSNTSKHRRAFDPLTVTHWGPTHWGPTHSWPLVLLPFLHMTCMAKSLCVQSEVAAGVRSGPRHSIACHAQHARDLKELARLGRWRQWRVLDVKRDESEKSKYKMSHVHRKRNTSTLQLCLQPSFTVWGNVNITECTSVFFSICTAAADMPGYACLFCWSREKEHTLHETCRMWNNVTIEITSCRTDPVMMLCLQQSERLLFSLPFRTCDHDDVRLTTCCSGFSRSYIHSNYKWHLYTVLRGFK